MRLRLHRAPTLQAFRQTLIGLLPWRDVELARATAVIVPTRSAAALLQRTIEDQLEPGQAAVLPDLLTRRDWYERLAERAAQPPQWLGSYERDVLMEAAAHAAITDGATPPFHLRSALIGEIVGLYDAVRRQRQDVASFERLVLEPLALEAESEGDAGAERMLRQTRFLAATFRGYEARRERLGACDEHTLREWLVQTRLARPYRTVVVAVADQAGDSNGLWSADFELITRLPDVEAVEIVATEAMLATGWFERLHDLLPGLVWGQTPMDWSFDAPRLLVPAGPTPAERRVGSDTKPFFVSRDREEELRDLVRRVRTVQRDERTRVSLGRIGVVFDRPLPYVYLAREVFAQGGVPFDARDALPLGAEPFAAAVDLVLSSAAAHFSRPALVALLASPHLHFTPRDGESAIHRLDVAALDAALEEGDHRGDADRLEALARGWIDGTLRSRFARWDPSGAARAARAGASVIRELTPLGTADAASVQLERLGGFLDGHLRVVAHDDPLRPRLLRAQQAVLAIIGGLAEAHRVHHDLLWTLGDLAADLRHRIEGQTFTPDTGEDGVQLVDAAAAPFGSFDALHLVGLVDGEWPRRQRRNIFYSPGLLTALGWPAEHADALAPARAMFVDLLQSPDAHASVSTFSLEDDALVEPSSLLDDIGRAGLTVIPIDVPDVRVFNDEALTAPAFAGAHAAGFGAASALADALDGETAQWAALRASRLAATLPRFHGEAGAQTPRARSVSALELYAQCPFKFYSRYVLRLAEERDDDEGLSPLERGRMHHELFEAIFAEWQSRGLGTVTPELLDQARALALATMDAHLARLSPVDAALERTRLVGSPVAPGLIDVVFRLEAERPIQVVERRLEHKIDGIYRFRGPDGVREIEMRGIADRIDLLADGTFRVLDYKASRPGSTLQIALYATCVRQKLRGYRGRDWELAEAAYVAFRGDKTVVPLTARPADNDQALADAEHEVVAIADAIARGQFPPRPRTRSLCQSCAFAAVCRKDYVDADQPALAV
ncbi:MAG: PD-(D/E)XK nuclease family protein [Vicinamibacteria bacterium]|nr:PD-(D/E)XK nuclease family protein [Vicinamibacteria bacterium]